MNTFVDGFENGYDQIVGERGARLSGGQRQRITIVRELCFEPPNIVPDEAINSLDEEMEGAVRRLKGRAILLVTHRMSTLTVCDAVHEMRSGKLARMESGFSTSSNRAVETPRVEQGVVT